VVLAEVHGSIPALGPAASNSGAKLSGGEQQMLAIARVLRAGPTLLLLDEPSGRVGAVVVQQIQKILRGLKRRAWRCCWFEQNLHSRSRWPTGHTLLVDGEVKETLTSPESRAQPRAARHLSV